jgi:hypothetical protein
MSLVSFIYCLYGFFKVGSVPKMYSDEFPQAYFELVNQAELGREGAVMGNTNMKNSKRSLKSSWRIRKEGM